MFILEIELFSVTLSLFCINVAFGYNKQLVGRPSRDLEPVAGKLLLLHLFGSSIWWEEATILGALLMTIGLHCNNTHGLAIGVYSDRFRGYVWHTLHFNFSAKDDFQFLNLDRLA